MQVKFAFGKSRLELVLPDQFKYSVLDVCSPPPLVEVGSELVKMLENPISGPPLLELARGRRTASIAVCDITRPAPNSITLPPLLETLRQAGISDKDVTILVATGLHRAASAEEIEQIVGSNVAARYKVLNHDAKNDSQHRLLGSTRNGTPVAIDSRFLDADLHITVGLIEPHLMLGFSGGRKLIAPGIAHQRTIKAIHSPVYMQDVRTTEGSIEDNPLHAELLEIARLARHDFILDVTIDRKRQISGIFAGSPEAAHSAGIEFVRNAMCCHVEGLMDAVITSAAGFPLDLTFYQSGKGLTAAQHIVKPEGRILLIAECAEGIGSAEFAERLRRFSKPEIFLSEVRSSPVTTDQWQLEKMAMLCRSFEVFFWTPGVKSQELGGLASRSFSTLNQAISAFIEGISPNATIGLLPEGPYVFARVRA